MGQVWGKLCRASSHGPGTRRRWVNIWEVNGINVPAWASPLPYCFQSAKAWKTDPHVWRNATETCLARYFAHSRYSMANGTCQLNWGLTASPHNMPEIVVSFLHTLSKTIPVRWAILSPFSRCRNWGSKWLSNLYSQAAGQWWQWNLNPASVTPEQEALSLILSCLCMYSN